MAHADPSRAGLHAAGDVATADRLAWLNDSPENDLAGYPGPGWDDDAAGPDPADEAYYLGFRLGIEGEYPAASKALAPSSTLAFYCGRLAGYMLSPEGLAWQDDLARWRDVADHEARMELAFGEPAEGVSDAERMEVMGSAAFPHRNDWD